MKQSKRCCHLLSFLSLSLSPSHILLDSISVTTFGEISPLLHKISSFFAIFGIVNLVFGKLLYLLWQFFMLLGKFSLL